MPGKARLESMLFQALERVLRIGPAVSDEVFDRRLQNWYENYYDELPDDIKREREALKELDKLFRKQPQKARNLMFWFATYEVAGSKQYKRFGTIEALFEWMQDWKDESGGIPVNLCIFKAESVFDWS